MQLRVHRLTQFVRRASQIALITTADKDFRQLLQSLASQALYNFQQQQQKQQQQQQEQQHQGASSTISTSSSGYH
jgi:3-phenylpropionate/cinnamic acid dioxygenase small subunit